MEERKKESVIDLAARQGASQAQIYQMKLKKLNAQKHG